MWTPEHRQAACRKGLRYDSNLTDAEWALVEPLIPPSKRGGRKRDVNVREITTQSPILPSELRPKTTLLFNLDYCEQMFPPAEQNMRNPVHHLLPAANIRACVPDGWQRVATLFIVVAPPPPAR
jgi:hypothetical protein